MRFDFSICIALFVAIASIIGSVLSYRLACKQMKSTQVLTNKQIESNRKLTLEHLKMQHLYEFQKDQLHILYKEKIDIYTSFLSAIDQLSNTKQSNVDTLLNKISLYASDELFNDCKFLVQIIKDNVEKEHVQKQIDRCRIKMKNELQELLHSQDKEAD